MTDKGRYCQVTKGIFNLLARRRSRSRVILVIGRYLPLIALALLWQKCDFWDFLREECAKRRALFRPFSGSAPAHTPTRPPIRIACLGGRVGVWTGAEAPTAHSQTDPYHWRIIIQKKRSKIISKQANRALLPPRSIFASQMQEYCRTDARRSA